MTTKQKTYSEQEKATIVLTALKNELTLAQISSKYQVHATQIGQWKKHALDNLHSLFKDHRKKERLKELEYQEKIDCLQRIIGQRDYELDWLKKKLSPDS